MFRVVRYISNSFLSLVAPAGCWVTQKPVADADQSLSADVRERITCELLMPFCKKCGATTGQYTQFDYDHPCPECSLRNLGVNSIIRVGVYDGPLASLITSLKFNRRFEIAEILGACLQQAISTHTYDGKNPPVDAVIPVPLHWWRHWMRGFNQAEEITRAACRKGNWPMIKPLWRIRSTPPQTAASRAMRQQHLVNIFWCEPTSQLAGKHVWLVDDVCTTGATIQAAVNAIRKLPKNKQPAGIHAAAVAITDRSEQNLS